MGSSATDQNARTVSISRNVVTVRTDGQLALHVVGVDELADPILLDAIVFYKTPGEHSVSATVCIDG